MIKKVIAMLISLGLISGLCPAVLGAESANTYGAMLRIDNLVELTWEVASEGTLNIYGVEYPEDPAPVPVGKSTASGSGSLMFDFLKAGVPYSDYYVFELCDTAGRLKEKRIIKTESLIPRRGKEITTIQHPYIITNQTEIDNIKAQIDSNPFYQKAYATLIELCNGYLSKYEETQSAPAKDERSSHNAMTAAVSRLGIAYVLSDDIRYAQMAKKLLMLYVEYYKQNDYIFAQNKDDGYPVNDMAIGYDLIFNTLNEVEQQLIENGYFREAADRLLKLSRGRMNNQGLTNWAVAEIGLLLNDHEYVDIALNKPDYGLMYNFINGIGDDGFWWEQNIAYHTERLEYTLWLAEAFYHCNYDLYDYQMSGVRETEYKGADCAVRPEGSIVNVEGKSIREEVELMFNFALSDLHYPVFGDADPAALKNSMIYELGYSRYGDERCAWLLNQYFGTERKTGSLADVRTIFASSPTIETGEYMIGNEQFNKKGVNKLGCTMLEDVGIAILRSYGDDTSSTNLATQWNRYGSAGHSHGDKLGIVLYGAGQEILRDVGRYTYGTTGQSEYAKHTIAHNTVVVDEKSQYPYTDSNNEWQADIDGEKSDGYMKSAAIGPEVRMLQIANDKVYKKMGVQEERILWQADDYVIDIFEALSSSEHQYDYPMTVGGTLKSSSVALQAQDPETPLSSALGYKHIKQLSRGNAGTDVWSSLWSLENGNTFRTTMLGDSETEVIKGNSLTKAGTYANEMLIARRKTSDGTTFINILEPNQDGNYRTVTQVPVKIRCREADWAKAAKIEDAQNNTTDTVVYGKSYGLKTAGSISTDAKSGFLRQQDGKDTILGCVDGKSLYGKQIGIEMKRPSSLVFSKLADGCYRLDFGGTGSTDISFTGLDGYKVFGMELSDEIRLTPVSVEEKPAFKAEADSIYILAKDGAEQTMPAPEKLSLGKKIKTYNPDEISKLRAAEETAGGIMIEAEDFVQEKGGRVSIAFSDASRTTNNPYGGAFYNWDSPGHTLAWKFNVPAAGKYKLMLRYATLTENSLRDIYVGSLEPFTCYFEPTSGWSDRTTGIVQDASGNDMILELEAGETTLSMENVNGSLNLDYIKFIPVR